MSTCNECGERMDEGTSACATCGAGEQPASAPDGDASSAPWRRERRRAGASSSPPSTDRPPTPAPAAPPSVPVAQWPSAAAPPPPPVTLPPPPPAPVAPAVAGSPGDGTGAPPARRRSVAPIAVAGVVALVVVGVLVGLVATRGDDGRAARGGANATSDGAVDDIVDAGGDEADAHGGSASEGETDGSASDEDTPPGPIQPVAATATAVRAGATLCTGEAVDYDPARLIDGDPDTGWGAGADDGTGQSITVDLGGSFRLTEIGLSPGYLKVGPRRDTGCESVEAFPRNRYVPRVEYRFDDGTTAVHGFDQVATVQTLAVDVVTTAVTITILETVLPPSADDDTILSEATFAGIPA